MLNLGLFGFANPWVLSALAGLPLLWWLLRVTPPAPRRLDFPAATLLFGLQPPEESPARTPLWLILLRMLIAALVILGLAQPILNPGAELSGDGPVVIVVDDGWSAAHDWPARQGLLERLLDQAERDNRQVALLTTAPDPRSPEGRPFELQSADAARRIVGGLAPKPWPGDRAALVARLRDVALPQAAETLWLSDGLDDGDAAALAERLRRLGPLTLFRDRAPDLPQLLLAPESDGLALRLRMRRAESGVAEGAVVLAGDEAGRLIARSELAFAAEQVETSAALDLPIELRNRISRLSIENQAGAGAVFLLDERWRRRPVGLIAGGTEMPQPLLSELYYLDRALDPFTEISRGEIGFLMARKLAVIVLADTGALPETQSSMLVDWLERGGVLLRFAGPRLAEAEDPLLPVRLRRGGRTLGGALTWDTPARLAPFPPDSPLAGLQVPDDVTIGRQVLAEPSLDLAEKTWARLTDGTPLITAERRGAGWLVLIHTTANAEWSNLPLSGLFVEILRRVVALSQGVTGEGEGEALPPLQVLDGLGRLGPPPPYVLALDDETLAAGAVGPSHPPGIYGSEGGRRALNLAAGDPPLAALPALSEARTEAYLRGEEFDLLPLLLTTALLLSLADLLIALHLHGLLGAAARGGTAVLLLALLPGVVGKATAQQTNEAAALAATLQTRLAYVVTGVPEVDRISEAGLDGLGRMLARRTAVEPGPPAGVEPGRQELAFYPLLYWPITPGQRDLDSAAVAALNDYLRNGGTVLIDLRELSAGSSLFGQNSRGVTALRRLTQGLEVPSLMPVPPDHVLTKSFYLMQDFPGRLAGGRLWIESTSETDNDGVASMLVGSNDWAAAWAVTEFGQPMMAVVPGGERQREMAFRFGVNLVMYALTGNYKADQVHVPFILERLGQ